ncbi:PREDICTED: peptide chain release factor 1, mitochondrial [Gekko japonicus]|uniref:Peptide chain release factor 1, mitochondrial n=1 Tax=Gekko japonicus TaxID=146911 RepID=A0ABM1LBL1_GEKJA|nr:PREDICTED: peptide chain release factor 1, mitochondrial [Gekko japonicus]XP_015283348.1 PREDICTED: peptide chain release factor 1, mitochondrial [Gekko japonicus]
MKLHPGISLYRTWFSNCCDQRHLPSLLAKRISHLVDLNTFQRSSLWSAVSSVLFNNWSRRYHQTSATLWNHEALQKYLQTLSQEYQRISQLLDDCSVSEHHRKALGKRHAELSPLAEVTEEIEEAKKEIQDLERLCAKLNTPEERQLLELALEEKEAADRRISTLCRKLFQILIPREKYDNCDAVLEVTSGRTTGGDICQQFTQEVFEMYQGYADFKRWTFEILNYTPTGYAGIHHAAARISGESVYRHLKYEGGTHRVQRIPETGLSSRMQRIHTGTMSVIVLPQTEEVQIKVDPRDLRIDTFRSRGAGGQHVNKTDSAVRIVHIPTGITVECQQDRSQLVNKETALRTLREKLYQQTIERELSKKTSARKLQLGTRAQSERIRTYNFSQDRVTDHRIAYEVRSIKEFLCGGAPLDDLISKLLEAAEMEALVEHLEHNCKPLQGD